jgi:hypothetical protein
MPSREDGREKTIGTVANAFPGQEDLETLKSTRSSYRGKFVSGREKSSLKTQSGFDFCGAGEENGTGLAVRCFLCCFRKVKQDFRSHSFISSCCLEV